ncbi:MAG: homoserine dehydrogenase [Ktedonobacterales bacterium]
MTRSISLIQLGVGRVGAAVVDLVERQAPRWQAQYDFAMSYAARADSHGFALLGRDAQVDATATHVAGQRPSSLPGAMSGEHWAEVLDVALAGVRTPGDLVVLDCAAGPATTPLLLAARAAGASVVLANKDPLIGPQAQYDSLIGGAGRSGGSLGMSATVGAGLPVVRTLAALVASGDTLLDVSACASGSLGFLCDQLSRGVAFDEALRQAIAQGYTEPDPRQDLSGFDVARKLLILARTAGRSAELSDVRVESLTPPDAEHLPLPAFLAAIPHYADHLADRVTRAQAQGRVLRYVARLDAGGQLSASLLDLPAADPLARGHGPENVFVLHTERYDANPLTIAGPGAGVAVTAGAVVADLLHVAGVL